LLHYYVLYCNDQFIEIAIDRIDIDQLVHTVLIASMLSTLMRLLFSKSRQLIEQCNTIAARRFPRVVDRKDIVPKADQKNLQYGRFLSS
jgi:hypothetical protein